MALINCSECNREVSDKAKTCPHCGNPMDSAILEENLSSCKIDDKEYIFCPECLSTHIHSEQKGFSGGKALAGAITVGAIGLLAGTIGSQKVKLTCLKCGCHFMAGDAFIATNKDKDEILKTFEKIILEKNEAQALTFLQEKMNWNYLQADKFKNAYLKGHKELEEKVTAPKTVNSIVFWNLLTYVVVLLILYVIMTVVWGIFTDFDFGLSFYITYSIFAILLFFFIVRKIIIPEMDKLKNKK